MKKFWERIKEHPIYSKVAAQLIGWAIIGIIGLIFSVLYFQSILNFTNKDWIVPMWGLLLIGIIPIVLLLGIRFILRRTVALTKKKPDWMSYTQDLIFDILWQWSYRWESIDSLRTDELIALCPKCKRELAIDKAYPTYSNSLTLICFNCDFKKNTNTRDFFNFKELVIREIQGRIRSREYKNKIKKTKEGCG